MNKKEIEFIAEKRGFKLHTFGELDGWEYPNGIIHPKLPAFRNSLSAQEKWIWQDDWVISFSNDGMCLIHKSDKTGKYITESAIGKGKTRANQAFAAALKVFGYKENDE